MTNEQLGRMWCERNGRRPDCRDSESWIWVYDDGPEYALPHPLYRAITSHYGYARFQSEDSAYVAIGCALRILRKQADEIAAILGEALA